MSESWEPLAIARSAEPQPPLAAAVPPPGLELPVPSPEQARATDAALAGDAEQSSAAGFLGFWSAGMLLNDLIQDAAAQMTEDDEDEALKDKKTP